MPSGIERIRLLLSRPAIHLGGLYEAVAEVIGDAERSSDPDLIRRAMQIIDSDSRKTGLAGAWRRLNSHLPWVEAGIPFAAVIEIPQPPPNRIEMVSAVSEELFAHLTEHPENRFRIKPRLFEEAVAELLNRMGWDVQLTPLSGDEGRDIIARKRVAPIPILMLVECKRYALRRPIGPEPITRLLYRVGLEGANAAMVVTTSTYQNTAQKISRERNYQVSLQDGSDFIEWIRKFRKQIGT